MARRAKADQPADAGPEAILPLTDFRADPWETGDEKAVAFKAGITSSPVPAAFAQRMRDEGKAARRFLRVACEVMPGGEIRNVGKFSTDEPIAAAATVTNQPDQD